MIMYVYGDITTDARVNRAANALADKFEVTVISTNFRKEVKDDKYNNILIGSASTGLMYLFQNILEAYRIIKRETPDYVYCHDYYSSLLAYLLTSRKCCKYLIYDAHELIIPESGVRDRRLAFFHYFEKHIINKVDKVICANEERGQLMKEHYHLKTKPVIIRNISQLLISTDSQTLRILESLDGFFSKPGPVVVYAGVVTKSRRISELATAVSSLAPKYKLLIVGQGDAIESIKSITDANPQLIAAFTGAVPYKALGAILSRCDIGFVYYPVNTLNNTYCASNKIYEYASVALPMISNKNPTIQKQLEINRIGVSSDDYASALNEIFNKIDTFKKSCENFTLANPWQNDANLLLTEVLKIC